MDFLQWPSKKSLSRLKEYNVQIWNCVFKEPEWKVEVSRKNSSAVAPWKDYEISAKEWEQTANLRICRLYPTVELRTVRGQLHIIALPNSLALTVRFHSSPRELCVDICNLLLDPKRPSLSCSPKLPCSSIHFASSPHSQAPIREGLPVAPRWLSFWGSARFYL